MTKRNSAFELIRIISILMIILSHYSGHGITTDYINNSFSLTIVANVAKTGNLGAILFMLISGYFMIDSSKISYKKITFLFLETSFYVVGLYAVSIAVGASELNFKDLYRSIFAVFSEKNWFISSYILIYIFHPYINKMLKSLERKELDTFAITMIFVWYLIPTFLLCNFGYNDVISLFSIYCFGAYLRLNRDRKFLNKNHCLFYMIVSSFAIVFSIIIFQLLSYKIDALAGLVNLFFYRNSIFSLLLGVGIIILTSNIKPYYSKAINFISSFSLGIYLIHDNEYFRRFMWDNIIKVNFHVEKGLLIPHMILSVFVVFLSCLFIDMARKYLLEKPFSSLLDAISKHSFKKRDFDN